MLKIETNNKKIYVPRGFERDVESGLEWASYKTSQLEGIEAEETKDMNDIYESGLNLKKLNKKDIIELIEREVGIEKLLEKFYEYDDGSILFHSMEEALAQPIIDGSILFKSIEGTLAQRIIDESKQRKNIHFIDIFLEFEEMILTILFPKTDKDKKSIQKKLNTLDIFKDLGYELDMILNYLEEDEGKSSFEKLSIEYYHFIYPSSEKIARKLKNYTPSKSVEGDTLEQILKNVIIDYNKQILQQFESKR